MEEYNVFITSVIGNVREKNEDNFYFDGEYRNINVTQECTISKKISMDVSHLFAVFDGMGGEHDGEIASGLSAKILGDYKTEIAKSKREKIDFVEVIHKLNDAVCEMAKERSNVMGSTAVIMRINNRQVTVCNVGDSRAYVYRNENLIQLTEDHTVAADNLRMCKALGIDFVDLGTGTANALTQHLGVKSDEFVLEPAISDIVSVKDGDLYMLCSDGLTHFVSEQEICKVLKQEISIRDKGETLKDLALVAGGTDNITIILLEVI